MSESLSLKELSERATPGPWAADFEKSDGSYGTGEDGGEGYDAAIILTEAKSYHGVNGILFDSHNSSVAIISEEYGEESFRAWDEVSEANARFIVAMVNAYRAGRLHTSEDLASAEAAAHAKGRAEGIGEAVKACEDRAAYFDAAQGYREWTDAARSYRATAADLWALRALLPTTGGSDAKR